MQQTGLSIPFGIEQLTQAYAQLPLPVLITDSEFRIVFINSAFVDMSGYELKDLSGKTPDLLSAEPAAYEIQQNVYETLLKQEVWTGTFRNTRFDGKEIFCETTISAIIDDHGTALAYIGIYIDITEQKLEEESVRESQKLFRAMAETLPLAIYLSTGIEQVCEYVNPKFEELFGYTIKDVPSAGRWFSLAYPDDTYRKMLFAKWQSGVERAIAANSFIEPEESVVTCKDGSLKNIQWSFFSLGEKNYACGLDLTEIKRSAQALRQNDTMIKKLFDHVPGMIFQFKKNACGIYSVPFATDAIQQIFGCTTGDVLNDFSPITRALFPEDLDKLIASIEASAENLSHWQCEFRVQIPGQPVRWMLGQSTPERLADGSILWHGFCTDITERKFAVNALIASQRLNAIGELASGVAHDFNNTLMIMSGNAELALRNDVSPETKILLEIINKAAQDAESRIRQLQRFAGCAEPI
ncbi:MAG: PAS domain S-box protein, partial [Candidatus Wallbacteria bacterium]|nr:PAS domain S-box protein [Candidatus Wallbacteria bacterium]